MTDKGKKTEQAKGSSTLLDSIPGKLGKITTVIVAVGTLLYAVGNMLGEVKSVSGLWKNLTGGEQKNCFQAELDVKPNTISFSDWGSVKFHLAGANKCSVPLTVHVAFKARSKAVRVEPTFKDSTQSVCSGYENSDCWEEKTLAPKENVDWMLIAPHLTRLGPLSHPTKIDINWIVYNTETKSRVRAGHAKIIVRDEGLPIVAPQSS